MASTLTGLDGIRVYLTGANADGGAQDKHALSLGGYRSSVLLEPFAVVPLAPIPGVVIDFASGENGAGEGTLKASTSGSLSWKAPGGTVGDSVAIANGESKILSDGGSSAKFICVTRTGASDLIGETPVRLTEVFNNAISGEDAEDLSATQAEYRAIVFKNVSSGTLTNLKIWLDPSTDAARFAIGIGSSATTGLVDLSVIGDIGSAPASVTFSSPTTLASALTRSTLAAGSRVGIWIRRSVPANAAVSHSLFAGLRWQWTSGTTNYTGQAGGYYRVGKTSTAGYRLYHAVGAEPDLTGAYTSISALPYDVTGLGAGTHYFVCRQVNKFGLISQNTRSYTITLDSSGEAVLDPPSAPVETAIEAGVSGTATITSLYPYLSDGDIAGDQWLIWTTTTGADPNLSNAPTATATMTKADGIAKLSYAVTGLSGAWDLRTVVRVGRTSDSGQSTNTTVVRKTQSAAAVSSLSPAGLMEFDTGPETVQTVWGSGSNRIDFVVETGVFRFILGGTIVAGISANGLFTAPTFTIASLATKILSKMIVIDGTTGSLEIGYYNVDRWARIAEITTGGAVKVASVVDNSNYPLTTSSTQYIQWDSSTSTVLFNNVTTGKMVARFSSGGLTTRDTCGFTKLP